MAYPEDVLIPKEIIIPIRNTTASQPHMSGSLFMSGAKLYFWAGDAKLITSA